ncbi:MAG: NHL repeat-containing protein [Ignavibacteriales bacterium]|nr:NHL repeat-containing protein [Ignavibacteriales bacterium]
MAKIISFLLTTSFIFAQGFIYKGEIGKFTDASSFSYSQSGFFYIADKNTNEIFKIDTLGNTIKYIGGYGWKESAFDEPVYIFSTTLNVYVTDKNNHRIQIFDRDLNFISQLKKKNVDSKENIPDTEIFGYPLCCVLSTMGDFFVLDSENKRILKFDGLGNSLLQFGGYDAGKYSLSDPENMAISSDNKIFVLDSDNLIIFDQFGNGLAKIKLSENYTRININFDQMVLNNKTKILFSSIDEKGFELKNPVLIGYDLNDEIVDCLLVGKNLFLLTKNQIIVFKKEKG